MPAKRPTFRAGRNIALKVPTHQWEQTVTFYKDVLGLPLMEEFAPDMVFDFDGKRLWLDEGEHMSQSEVWLEIMCDDSEEAGRYLAMHDITRCDHIEPLPPGFSAFWVSSPGGIIHLVTAEQD